MNYQKLFDYMSNEHDCTLLQTDMREIVLIVKEMLKPAKRTLTQNRYLHLLISLFAIEIGYTLDEAKIHLKRKCDFMVYDKNGEKFVKRSRDLDTKELTDWIEWIKNYAGINGIHLPSPDDYKRNWQELENTIERNKQYL